MLWLFGLIVLAVAVAIRIYINRGQTTGSPDEKRYTLYAFHWRPGKSFTKDVDTFLALPGLEIPPTRVGFFAICRLTTLRKKEWSRCFPTITWIAAISAALTAPLAFLVTHDLPSSLLVASSPLSLYLSRRALQDSFTALLLLGAVWAVHLQNPWLLGVMSCLALLSREALLVYLPALLLAWCIKTGHWLNGGVALALGLLAAIGVFYALGGRRLVAVFKKLKQPTDYVRRFQSGMPHRILVDLTLVSPVIVVAVLASWAYGPRWLLAFTIGAVVTHACINPKNVRFMLIVDVCLRMLCASLPGPWPWIVLALGVPVDIWLYRAFGTTIDPVTNNLMLRTRMYLEK